MTLSNLEVGSRYQVKEDCRGGNKFQYTTHWRKNGDPKQPHLKDAIAEVIEKDEHGDYKVYVYDTTTGQKTKDSLTFISKVEVKYFELAASTPVPAAKGVPVPKASVGGGLQIPLMDATDASTGLATMIASLLMGAIKSPDVEQMVTDAIKEVATQKIPRPVEIVFDGKRQVVEDTHQKFDTVMKLLQATRNIMLVGEAGCGKTHLAAQVAHSLSLEFSSVSCSSDMSSSVLTGWLLPANGGAFEYAESDFVRLYENGGVFLLDEMDSADPAILLIINQALANGQLTIPQRKGNTTVKRHPNFVCMGACNTFGRGSNLMYSGRERLDESTLDRFRSGMVEMHYDDKLEERLVDAEVLAWGRGVRKRIEDAKLKRVMSTRFLRDATALKELSGYSMQEIKDLFFVGWHDDEKSKVNR
jgi:MoxR-like ATPase